MPELPEVETVRRSLEPHLAGRVVADAVVRERRLRYPIASGFEERLRQRQIESLGRLGKYLLFGLDDGRTLLVHLGMSGSLHLRRHNAAPQRHDHVIIDVGNGQTLVFNDPRRFGLMKIGALGEFKELSRMGPDPLALDWSIDDWRQKLRRRRVPIKSLLMDQTFVAGIGNIYANEMLFVAGIRPRRLATRIRRREIARLGPAVATVLRRAIDLGGSSISDFRDGRGKLGYFQIHHVVYDRAGEPCRRCPSAIKKIELSGRSTFYCPTCQT